MAKKKPAITAKDLAEKGVPAVLIPGLLMAIVLGWNGNLLNKSQNYNSITEVFPYRVAVQSVVDGDTFLTSGGQSVRLLAINAPDRGNPLYQKAKDELSSVLQKDIPVYLEYDRYQDDKYGRILAWVWVGCEGRPAFLPFDFMHKSANASNPGIMKNPKNCDTGILVNEYMAKNGYGAFVTYKDRGELKYQKRIEESIPHASQ